MSALASKDPLRSSSALSIALTGVMLSAAPYGFALLRRVAPSLKLGQTIILSRYDDVVEALENDELFDTPYRPNIEILTGGEPFFLGMRDGDDYRQGLNAMRSVFREGDLARLGDEAETRAQAIVDAANGKLEVVGDLVRKVTFDLYIDYIGIPRNAHDNIDVWSTRLFEFQFASTPKDTELRKEVDEIAPAFRAHIDQAIADRRNSGEMKDDVLGRCLAEQASGQALFSDMFIRTNLLCMMLGGPPQLPMVVPQALEQLLRFPEAMAGAKAAASADDDDVLWGYFQEALRFDPLAPALPRVAVAEGKVAEGRRHEKEVNKGTKLIVGFASAMCDPRRVAKPKTFDAGRMPHEYILFGHALHECFGRFLNRATLHRILKPLLKEPALRRAPGKEGKLKKRKIFSDELHVRY